MSEDITTESADQPVLMSEGPKILSGFLDKLVAPTTIKIKDVYGNEYELSAKVSARVQIKIGREFERAMSAINTENLFEDMDPGVGGMVKAFVGIAGQEGVLDALDNCFSIAHSSALATATKAAKKDKTMVKNPTAMDLFSLEDILGAVLPLFLGLIQKGATILTKIAQNQ